MHKQTPSRWVRLLEWAFPYVARQRLRLECSESERDFMRSLASRTESEYWMRRVMTGKSEVEAVKEISLATQRKR